MLNKRLNKKNIQPRMQCLSFWLLCLFSCVSGSSAIAEEVTVAVASNFHPSLKILKQVFEQQTPHQLAIVSGSTGKLYSQIIYGAPFDIFMSADKQTPLLLEKNGLGIKDSRFTYAIGQLVLWSANAELIHADDHQGNILLDKNINKIAIANPKLAPYGKAALETIQSISSNSLKDKLVMGENISQVFHLVASGSAEIGFVALSQIKNPSTDFGGSYWIVPESTHQPIEQQAIVLNKNKAVEEFISFLKSPQAIKIIKSFGYQVEVNSEPDVVMNNSMEN